MRFDDEGTLIETPRRVAPLPTMPAEHLEHARARLGMLPRDELVARYLALPGRRKQHTLLSDKALIEVLAFAGVAA